MSVLITEKITVKANDGTEAEAALTICPCGCMSWVVFALAGQDHHHLQCYACGRVFCPNAAQCKELLNSLRRRH